MSAGGMTRILLLVLVVALPAAACTQAERQEAVQAVLPAVTATVVARDLEFEPAQLRMPANQPLVIVLDNQDSGVPHSIAISRGTLEVFKGEITTGISRTEHAFGPLPPGEYRFSCVVHPNMTGTLLVAP